MKHLLITNRSRGGCGVWAENNVITPHDFHATIMHLLGLDHEKLTFYNNGIQRRLTDEHGRVIHEVLS